MYKNKYYKAFRNMLKTKRAFTFAELMISLTVIAIITVILYPTLSDMAPNNNQYLFKSAYRTIETTTSDIMNTAKGNALPNTQTGLCYAFCSRLNTISISPSGTCGSVNAGGVVNPLCTAFITSNGMRWAFSANGNTGYVLVDINTLNNEKASDTSANVAGNDNQMPANTPALNVWGAKGVFYTGDDITHDTFLFSIDSAGKITPIGSVARTHMQSGN